MAHLRDKVHAPTRKEHYPVNSLKIRARVPKDDAVLRVLMESVAMPNRRFILANLRIDEPSAWAYIELVSDDLPLMKDTA